jgi:hypothetical protein
MLSDERIRRRLPPYVSYRTFKTFLERLEQGIPARIDRSFWGESFSGTTGNQLMAALMFLSLVDGSGTPTNRLKLLVGAKDVKRNDILKQTCMDAFDFLFKGTFDTQTATPAQMQKAFHSNFKISAGVNRKCIKFFMDMANDAGISLSPFITSKKMISKMAKNTAMYQNTEENSGKSTWDTKLLEKFPSFDPTWPDEIKNKWFQAFDELLRRGITKP